MFIIEFSNPTVSKPNDLPHNSVIEIDHLKKSYGLNKVLEIENFKLSEGVYWLVGENGSGKSTFLKIVAGILDFEGNVTLDQLVAVKRDPVKFRRLVNFAEAEPIFPDFLTGQDLIQLFASAKSAPSNQEAPYVEQFNMSEFLSDPVSTYSSGMLKKLSLILAFLGRPRLILLDEPLVTIDKEALRVLQGMIRDLHLERGINFILSSHQQVESDDFYTAKLRLNDCTLSME